MFIQAHFIRKALGFLIFGSRQSHCSLSFFFFSLQKCNTFFTLRKQEIERLLLAIAIHDPICCLCEEKNMEDVSCSAHTVTGWAHREEQRLVSLLEPTFVQQHNNYTASEDTCKSIDPWCITEANALAVFTVYCWISSSWVCGCCQRGKGIPSSPLLCPQPALWVLGRSHIFYSGEFYALSVCNALAIYFLIA